MEIGKCMASKSILNDTAYFNWIQRFAVASFIFFFFFSGLSLASTLTVGNGKEYSSIQAAVDDASCGDTVDIYSGIYNEAITIRKIGCTSSKYLTFRAAENGVVLDIKNSHEYCYNDGESNYYAAICVQSALYLHIGGNGKKIEIRNIGVSSPTSQYHAVHLYDSDYSNIQDIKVTSGTGGDGRLENNDKSSVYGIGANSSPNLTIKNNEIVPGANQIDYCYYIRFGSGYLVSGNICKNPMKSSFYSVHSDDFIYEKNYNFMYVNHGKTVFGPVWREFEGGIIRYNIFEIGAASGSRVFGSIFFYDNNNNDSEGAQIYNNILIGNSNVDAAIFMSQGIQNISLKNNIITNPNYAYYQIYEGGTSTITSQNNIFTTASGEYDPDGSLKITSSNNFFHSVNYYSSGNEPYPYFKPSSESAYQVDKGTDVGYAGTDYRGNKVPNGNGTDIGAFEYNPTNLIADVPPNPPLLISID